MKSIKVVAVDMSPDGPPGHPIWLCISIGSDSDVVGLHLTVREAEAIMKALASVLGID